MFIGYNYVCPACDTEVFELNKYEDRDKEKCPKCGTFMERPAYLNFPNVGRTQPIVLENIAREPMTFKNKKDLAKYCKEHKVRSSMCD